jgi:hypothetical protein
MTRAVNTALAGSGGVLQVVSTTKTDSFTSTSATLVDITGLSVSITPSSSSNKVLVFGHVVTGAYSWTGGPVRFVIVRDSTNIGVGTGGAARNATIGLNVYAGDASNTAENHASLGFSFLDSPATTSAITYKIQGAIQIAGVTWAVNRQASNANNGYISTITVMEIAG